MNNEGLEKIVEMAKKDIDTHDKAPLNNDKVNMAKIEYWIRIASQASREEARKEVVLDMWDNTFMDNMCAKRDCLCGFTTEESQRMTDEWILVWKKVMGDMHIET